MHATARFFAGLSCMGALLAGAPAWACSVCGCGDPLLSASDPAAVNGRMRLELDTEYLTVKAGNDADSARTDKLDQYTLRLNAVYSPWEGLSFIGMLPYTRKNLATDGITGSDISGVGDAELGARYTFLQFIDFAARRRQTFAVSAGTSLPTGSDGARLPDGERVDEHGQIGTGAWGPYAGLHYRLEQEGWMGYASATGRVRTANSFDYRYGNALLWSVHGQYRPIARFALDVGVDGRHAAADRQAGAAVANTGGTVLAVSPGVYWNAAGPVWLAVRAQLPFHSDLLGQQSVGPTVVAGVQYLVF
jgi:hypothetical protein